MAEPFYLLSLPLSYSPPTIYLKTLKKTNPKGNGSVYKPIFPNKNTVIPIGVLS